MFKVIEKSKNKKAKPGTQMLLRVTNKDIIHKNIVYIHCCSVSMVNFEQVLSREFKFVDFGWTSIAHKLVFYKSKWRIQCRTLREMCLYFRSFPGLYFTAFRLNTDSVSLRIQSECTKIRTRKTPNTDTFHVVECTNKGACRTLSNIR